MCRQLQQPQVPAVQAVYPVSPLNLMQCATTLRYKYRAVKSFPLLLPGVMTVPPTPKLPEPQEPQTDQSGVEHEMPSKPGQEGESAAAAALNEFVRVLNHHRVVKVHSGIVPAR